MKKFVVGFISFFDNELKLEIVYAESKAEAMRKCSFTQGYEFPANAPAEMIETIMFDCDSAISTLEI